MTGGIAAKSTSEERLTVAATADSDLVVPLVADGVYLIRGRFFMSAHETPDMKIGLSSTATITRGSLYVDGDNATVAVSTGHISTSDDKAGIIKASDLSSVTRSIAGAGGSSYLDNYASYNTVGLLQVSADGSLAPMWAQNTADATWPTVMRAGSGISWENINHTDSKTLWAFKTSNETRSRSEYPTLYDDSELYLTLQANTSYWVTSVLECYVGSTFAARFNSKFDFSGDVTNTHVHRGRIIVAPTSTWGANFFLNSIYNGTTGLSAELQVFNDYGDNSAYRGGMYTNGLLQVGANGGELRLQWRTSDNGGSDRSSTLYAGSWLIARELNECS